MQTSEAKGMGRRLRSWWQHLPEADKGILTVTALLLAVAVVIAAVTLTGLPGDRVGL